MRIAQDQEEKRQKIQNCLFYFAGALAGAEAGVDAAGAASVAAGAAAGAASVAAGAATGAADGMAAEPFTGAGTVTFSITPPPVLTPR